MAFSTAAVRLDADVEVYDCISDADADVGPFDVGHGLGSVPVEVILVPMLAPFYLNEWTVNSINAARVQVTGANAVGSGDADVQLRVIIRIDPYLSR